MALIKKPSFPFFFFIFLFFLLPNFQCLAQQQGPTYLSFVFNATEFPSEENYDYIVVGGGTAGCPLAATLSENYRVLLIERGGHILEHPNLSTQEGFLQTLTHADDPDSPAEHFTSEDGVQNARGRVLGGSSAINAGFYSRAEPQFFRQSGFNWDLDLVNRSYEWVEKSIVFRPELKNWQSSVRDGLLEANILPYNGFNLDHIVGTKIGGSTFDSSGRRHSAADLLNEAKPFNVRIALHASVERILLSNTADAGSESTSAKQAAAIGVVYRDKMGRRHRAMVRRNGEVIISAGALGSPQLLLLSGIGPRPYLSSWGIPVVHHLPYVGHFLYDNPRNGISILPPIPLDHSLIQVVGITDSGTYIEAASNIIPFSPPPGNAFVHNPPSPLYFTVATIMEKITGPVSVGSLWLGSTDVRVSPVVRFNYFANAADLARCVQGMRKIGEILRGRSLEDFKFREWFGGREFRFVGPMLPFDLSNDRLMEEFCQRTVATIWHYHGGCVVGKVVDGDHRVIGLDKLRIVDGSTFHISPGTNPQATVMMLGRYVGLKLMEEEDERKRQRGKH